LIPIGIRAVTTFLVLVVLTAVGVAIQAAPIFTAVVDGLAVLGCIVTFNYQERRLKRIRREEERDRPSPEDYN
jgi:hypothetical protein